jgi:peptide chain release factor 3
MTVFESGSERLPQDFETIPLSEQSKLAERFAMEWTTAMDSM